MASVNNRIDEVLAELKRIEDKLDQRTLTTEQKAFVEQLVEEARYRKEFWRKMLERVAAGTVWTIVIATFTGLLFMAREFLKNFN